MYFSATIRFRDDVGIVPYDLAEDFLSVLGTDGDEVGTVQAVVVITQAILLPLRRFHDCTVLCGFLTV